MWRTYQTEVQLEGCRLDLVRRRVYFSDRTLKLTSREVQVLRYMLDRPGEVASRTDLERDVWALGPNVRSDAVAIAMRRLRTKIEPDPSNPINLQTVHGVGWTFRVPEAPSIGRGNLPHASDAFVGRVAELAALDGLTRRLAVLTGPPGVGKTRLALEWAHRQLDAGAVGEAWLVDCGSGDEPLAARVAQTMDLRTDSPQALVSALASRGNVLLILDAADGVQAPRSWLDQSPNLRILLTCRASDSPARIEIDPMEPADGAELLRARMQELDREPDSAEELEALVRSVDGLPLALELCASHARLMTLGRLAERIQERPLEPVREAFEWSWSQLSPPLQRFLQSACVFARWFSLDAAGGICPVEGDLVETLALLADRAMIRIDPDGPRFSVAPGIRRFLVDGVDDDARRRHTAWYLERGERVAAKVPSKEGAEALRALRGALPELDQARRYSSGSDRARLALVQSVAMQQHGTPARRLRLLEDVPDDLDDELLGTLLGERGYLHSVVGNLAAAEQDLSRALAVADTARNWRFLGFLRLRIGQDDAAREAIENGLARQDSDPETQAMLYGDLGTVLTRLGARSEAEAAFRHGLGIAQVAGDAIREGLLTMALGDHHSYYNAYDKADVELQRSIAINLSVGAEAYVGWAESVLGLIHTQLGDTDEALEWLDKAATRLRRLGEDAYLIIALNNLADLHIVLEDYDSAVVACSEAETISRREGLGRYRAIILVTQATAYRKIDAPDLARRCLEQVDQMQTSRREKVYAHAHLAAIAADAGRLDDAEAYLGRIDAVLPDLGDPNAAAMASVSRAHVAAARGEPERVASYAEKARPYAQSSVDVRIALELLDRAT